MVALESIGILKQAGASSSAWKVTDKDPTVISYGV